ncbi:M48 family peptidase [bacterium M00.F.Ca.ET.228.01.1.1]|uniref:M48 family metalloprotease n=1 Tax=Paraburkholderia phenoliruptrix TaxID=252970 RepID=UPI001092B565|nr:M48 family metalloprotease [Paraburkholderia phenoliruptrix]TGP44104.1 M48 family peptidase [bacterium M00.F.Ca.ET.228.01.1.1]TGS01767.1 M48 family peptidase [bacterium M00.F.Ca.ET.191.01.1.1]TGU08628.1 M48 family peptidase [bacterium M00.F.Ca.ET.155.01.1.1]MBW0450803.1 M48 family metallopeptidase [Paraburkholderia phenoliruptrix]MBW9097226.1 M48 family metallopeptidase [Paraburkholderia phenoliruptrix]
MRPKRFPAALLCIALAVPPAASAQARAASGAAPAAQSAQSAEPPLVSGPVESYADPLVPPEIAQGVFGVYGGAQSRFSGNFALNRGASSGNNGENSGGNSGWRAPITAQQLPDLGSGGAGTLTPQAERKLGERVMRELRRDPDYLDDWLVRDYLNSVAGKLAAAANALYIGGYRPDFDLFAVRDPQINAFSLPGGFIGVNTGLIVTTQTESELASVLGHEMGHVLQRHISRMITTGERSGYAALAGMLFGVLAGVLAHSGDLGSAIAIGGQAYAVDNQLRFSRSAEHEADRVGFLLLAGAGYDPYAMTTFFGRLDRASMSDTGIPAYARTHPLTGERIADMEDRARRAPYRQPHQASEYGFVRARARLLQDRSRSDYADEISRLRSEIEDRTAPNVAANWYGIAYGQMLLERYDDAAQSLAASRAAFAAGAQAEGDAARSSPSLDVLAADIARRAGRDQDALRLAELAQTRWPQSNAAIDMHIRTLLSLRRFAEAQALAQKETRAQPDQPAWWLYLAQASAGSGDALTRHRALAEKFALEGAWPSAIRQLKDARDMKTIGYYDLATVDARLHEMENRYKEERLDEKS